MDARANLDRHLRGSHRLDLTGLAWDDIARHPLSDAGARCLAYMMDVETHTMIFLRDLLATRAAEEPEITAFLACWAYEELWHGEAFSRFLGEAGVRLAPDGELPGRDDAYPSRVDRNSWIRRARRTTRVALDRLWAMVGTGIRPQEETDFVVMHLFGDPDGLQTAHRLDATIGSLPGLDGLRLIERARAEAMARADGVRASA